MENWEKTVKGLGRLLWFLYRSLGMVYLRSLPLKNYTLEGLFGLKIGMCGVNEL